MLATLLHMSLIYQYRETFRWNTRKLSLQLGLPHSKRRRSFLFNLLPAHGTLHTSPKTSVVDPDPDPDWIRIQSGLWIRIRGKKVRKKKM